MPDLFTRTTPCPACDPTVSRTFCPECLSLRVLSRTLPLEEAEVILALQQRLARLEALINQLHLRTTPGGRVPLDAVSRTSLPEELGYAPTSPEYSL